MAKDNEIMKSTGAELAPQMDAMSLSEIAEELDGLGDISFDSVKIPSGGGLAFEVPGDDPESPDIAKEISGVVIVRHAANGYWKDPFSGGNTPPDCYSNDGKIGVVTGTGECRSCDECPRNQFNDDGSGKDCKNMQNLYIVREGDILPIRLVLPPTSIKNLRDYVSKRLLFKGKKLDQVVTAITLSKAESRQGIKYAQAQFCKKRDLTPEEIAEMVPIKNMVRKALANQTAAPAADYSEVVPDEPLPFDAEELPV